MTKSTNAELQEIIIKGKVRVKPSERFPDAEPAVSVSFIAANNGHRQSVMYNFCFDLEQHQKEQIEEFRSKCEALAESVFSKGLP